MKMKTLKEGIIAHADGLGKLFKFSAEHTYNSSGVLPEMALIG